MITRKKKEKIRKLIGVVVVPCEGITYYSQPTNCCLVWTKRYHTYTMHGLSPKPTYVRNLVDDNTISRKVGQSAVCRLWQQGVGRLLSG